MLLYIHVSVLCWTFSFIVLLGEAGLMKSASLLAFFIIPGGKLPCVNVLWIISEW